MQNIVRNNFRRFKHCFDIPLFRIFLANFLSYVALERQNQWRYIENALRGPLLLLIYMVILLKDYLTQRSIDNNFFRIL